MPESTEVYEAPQLAEVGEYREMTLGNRGFNWDADIGFNLQTSS